MVHIVFARIIYHKLRCWSKVLQANRWGVGWWWYCVFFQRVSLILGVECVSTNRKTGYNVNKTRIVWFTSTSIHITEVSKDNI